MNGNAAWYVGALILVIGILLFFKGERRMRDVRQTREKLKERLEEIERDQAKRRTEKE